MAGQIPINFVTHPAVSLRAACFGNNVYEYYSAGKCLSNLLAVGYRRFVVDLYWSPTRRTWAFCPVSIPKDEDVVTVSSSTVTPTSSPTATVSAGSMITAVPDSSGSLLYQLGPYSCSKDFGLSELIDVFAGYFRVTASQMNVYMEYVMFNLHAAADPSAPDAPAPTLSGDQLPRISDHVRSYMENSLSLYIYGPTELAGERNNLNDSWYGVDDSYKPITEYFTIVEGPDGTQSTPDGWPCSKYVQLARQRRLLLEYGSVDSQLQGYDEIKGNEFIFPPNYLTSARNVSTTADGSLSSCLYNASVTQVSQANSSWAESPSFPIPNNLSQTDTLGQTTNLIAKLTACGLSPRLNSTLFATSADNTASPYQNISLSASWAWAVGEPQDTSTPGNDDQPQMDRCTVMDLSLGGHWRAVNCPESRHVACRVKNGPFSWTLSSNLSTYNNAWDPGICPPGSEFAVPRTSLENTYLYRSVLSQTAIPMDPSSSDPAMREVWLDFNSLDALSCWVAGGPKASCPYSTDPGQLEKKTVLVALIAGIVVCIIAALTFFVKCNTNRRNSRRRKRAIQGWDYEGVPS